jgi:hypothetical protein
MNNNPLTSWEEDSFNGESFLPPDNNNPVYQSLSDKTKLFIKEIGQDVNQMYTMLQYITDLLDGNISEEDFLKRFYGQYRPNKCKFMIEGE